MDTIGPISRTVEDAAITLEVIAGHDPKDPYTWNSPVPAYRQSLDQNIASMRVGLVTELMKSDQVEVEVRETVLKAISVLEELGASVEEVSIPLIAHANTISSVLLAVEPAMNHHEWVRKRLHDYGHANQIGLLTGSLIPGQAYQKAQKLRSLLRHQVH